MPREFPLATPPQPAPFRVIRHLPIHTSHLGLAAWIAVQAVLPHAHSLAHTLRSSAHACEESCGARGEARGCRSDSEHPLIGPDTAPAERSPSHDCPVCRLLQAGTKKARPLAADLSAAAWSQIEGGETLLPSREAPPRALRPGRGPRSPRAPPV